MNDDCGKNVCSQQAGNTGAESLPEVEMLAHGKEGLGSRPAEHGSQLRQSGPCGRADPSSDVAFASRLLLQLCPSYLLLPAALPAEGHHTFGPAVCCQDDHGTSILLSGGAVRGQCSCAVQPSALAVPSAACCFAGWSAEAQNGRKC